MHRYLICVLLVVPAVCQAQTGRSRLVSPDAARQVGLERMWFTQLNLDRGRGRMAGTHMYVSPSQSHSVFQVSHEGRRYVFSQRDRNAFGEEIGVEGAQKKAAEKAEAIKEELIKIGKADAAAPSVESFVVPKITLYLTSERGTVHALDCETGRTLWTTSVGNPLFPMTAPAANDKYVAVCNGSTVYVLLAANGSVAWSRGALGAPGAGPAMTEEFLFLPMVNGQVESLYLEDPRRPVGVFKSFGRTMVQPVVSATSVAWPTDAGNLYVSPAHAPGLQFRFQAGGAISAAPAFLEPGKIFTASLDGYIYCIDERKGNVMWRFTTGEAITHSPIALHDMVYAISTRGNMFAVEAATGVERWVTSGIRHYLAGNDKRLYCLDTRGDLVVLDRESGSRLGSLAGVGVDVPFLNTQTDRILLANSTGLIQCLREISLPWPILHVEREAPAPARPTRPQGPPTEDKPPQQVEGDPFGTPAAAPGRPPAGAAGDPFATPAPPRPSPPPAGDPFATP
jgi:outer membrane protein assembly factor BamB